MRILLDTHVLIWTLTSPDRFSTRTRDLIAASATTTLFSAANIWEIAIKAGQKRADFDIDPYTILSGALAAGFVELPVSATAAARVAGLPSHHRDPFDRLLVAQAIDEGAQLLTADAALGLYGSHVLTLA